MTHDLPPATVIVPNYNGAEHLEECLRSLEQLDYPEGRLEILVVDNGSTDDSIPLIRRRFSSVHVVEAGRNLGFAGGCNRGVQEATGSIVAFLNNDMRADPAWLRTLLAPLTEEPDVAATGGKILSWDGKTIDFVAGNVNFYGHGFQPLHGRPAEDAQDLARGAALFACGGSMAARRDVFLSAGGFDEDYFAFFEDIDFGWRLWVLGYRVVLVPEAVSYHRGHATGSRLPPHQLRVLYERNALATVIKNYDDANLARVLPAALLLLGQRALVYGELDREGYREWADAGDDAQAVKRVGLSHLVALAEVAGSAERLWAKRAAVQSARRRSDREIFPLFEAPFQTNCLDQDYMEVQGQLQRVFAIDRIFASQDRAPRVLIISNDTVNERMAGPGIRAWEMAKVLSCHHPVTLAVPNDDPLAGDGFRVVGYGSKAGRGLRELAAEHDVLVVQGFVLHLFPYLAQQGKPLVVDLYDPFTLENLHVFAHDPMEERSAVHESHLGVLNAQLRAGDFFLCASEKQRDYWLGMLAANNRINPLQYDADPTLRHLIDVVPFGIPAEPPTATRCVLKGVYPGIGPDDRVILWGGGIWEWFDPLTLIGAVERIRGTRPEVKLFFMGIKHPNPMVPAMAMTSRAVELARSLGLEGKGVFFNDWVPYGERQNYLLEADVGVSLHFDHLETRFSFRTRVLDYLWAGLPVVCTRGDAIADLVESEGLGRTVDYEDVDGLVEALLAVLDDSGGRTAYGDRFHTVARGLTWEQLVEPLRRFCTEPHPAADHRAQVQGLELGMRTAAGQSAIRSPKFAFLEPAPSPTPLWRLPARAWLYLRIGGLSRLAREAASYLRWLRLRAAR